MLELNTTHCGDCLELMKEIPDGSIDLVLTDPPYGMNYHSGWYVGENPHAKIEGDDSFPAEAIAHCIRIAKRAAYVFCRWDNMKDLPLKPDSFLVWLKDNHTAGDLLHEHGRKWEGIAFYAKEKHEFIKRIPDVIYCPRISAPKLIHPTQKPVPLLRQIIMANVADTVLDVYAGAGSTCVAALLEHRDFIGIELSPKYCKIANDRCAAAKLQIPLKEYRAGQRSLFDD